MSTAFRGRASMTVTAPTEVELAATVIAWLEALGADVYQEVELRASCGRADIVARVRAELWILETKTRFSLDLIGQALDRRRDAHRVIIAVPAASALRGGIPRALCLELGIGLLAVDIGSDLTFHPPRVVELCPSLRWNSRPVALAAKLCPEHKTHARAGAPTGGHWTPFRATVEAVAEWVRREPGRPIRDAIENVKHHYRSNAGARSSIAHWIFHHKVPGVVLRDGLLFPDDPVH